MRDGEARGRARAGAGLLGAARQLDGLSGGS